MNNKYTFKLSGILLPISLLIALILIRFQASLSLFHTVAELFSIVVGIVMFIIVWNTRRFTRNDFLVYLGIGYLGVSILDAFHALAFQSMPLWSADNLQITIHFWIYSRTFEALLLLSAPLFLYKKLNARLALGYCLICVSLISWAAIQFNAPLLITDNGLTSIKIISEYLIIGLYLVAIFYFLGAAKLLAAHVRKLILISLILTILAELTFTLYTDYRGIAFVIGHLFKFLSFWTIYLAIVRTTLNEPFEVLSNVSTSYNAIPQPILTLDNQANIVQANKAAERLTQTFTDALTYQPVHPLFHSLDKKEETCELCHAIKQGGLIEAQTIWNETLKRWFIVSLAPVYFGNKSSGMIQTSVDITEQKSAEQALRRSHKMDALGQLTGGIAHDFNNILGIILGNTQLLEMQTGFDEKSLTRFKAIQKATNRAIDLTKQLLSFSRGKSQHSEIADINLLIREMDSLIAHSLTPVIEVKFHLDENIAMVKFDKGQFQDALLNLILNARDAMLNDGRLTVETRNCTLNSAYCNIHTTLKPGKYVQLVISDNGSGMTTEQLDHIFEPFYTTKSLDKGTGLGLAMVYGFIKNSGASIEVFSEVEYGSSFKFYFPQVGVSSEPTENKVRLKHSIPHGDETILIVDDEEALLTLAKETLQTIGYTILLAANGQQALEILEQNSDIQLLFTDIVMPGGINGYQLAEQAISLRPDIKILLTSGYTGNTKITDVQQKFTKHLLHKPYTKSEMASYIRNILG